MILPRFFTKVAGQETLQALRMRRSASDAKSSSPTQQ
jgi:hypothetical protein